MSGVKLTISISDGGLGAALQRAIVQADDLSEPLRAAGSVLTDNIDRRFATGKGPGGIPWPPSGRAKFEARPGGFTKAGKRGKTKAAIGKIGPNQSRTLVRTGALRDSITDSVGRNQVEVGVQNPAPGGAQVYAAVHQFGATITAKNKPFLAFVGADGAMVFTKQVTIPARPYVGFDDQDVADLTDLFTESMRLAFDGD